jgi:hypothetical protein
LVQNFTNIQYIDVYIVSPFTQEYTLTTGGMQRPYNERDYQLNLHAFDLDFPSGTEHEIIIRFENPGRNDAAINPLVG